MVKIWAQRLLAGTRKFENVPVALQAAVKDILQAMFDNGDISAEDFHKALGDDTNA